MEDANKDRRLGIIGAGPVGLEAALEARERGWEVEVFEAGPSVATHVRRWAHVPLFTPWGWVLGPRGRATLEAAAADLPDEEEPLRGEDLLKMYLEPLAEQPDLEGRLRTRHRVLGVSRRRYRKTEIPGDARRAEDPFLLHVLNPRMRETHVEVDAVFDCSGVLGRPAGLGPGGAAALGERLLAGVEEEAGLLRRIPDALGGDRSRLAGRRVLILGAGHSAANAVTALERLASEEPDTRVTWVWRHRGEPFRPDQDDPLPLRRELEQQAAALVEEPPPWLTLLPDHTLEALHVEGSGHAARLAGRVTLQGPEGAREIGCDVLVALVGYRPDTDLHRELQVHTCYATEGPMALAAKLMEEGGGDCLGQPEAGPEALATTEPRFFVLGHKSYGRNPYFLLRDGYRQVRQACDLLDTNARGAAVGAAAGKGEG